MVESCPRCKEGLELMALDKEVGGLKAREYFVCHKCEKIYPKTEVYSRCCGYLRPTDQWNPGKKEEFQQREVYRIEE